MCLLDCYYYYCYYYHESHSYLTSALVCTAGGCGVRGGGDASGVSAPGPVGVFVGTQAAPPTDRGKLSRPPDMCVCLCALLKVLLILPQ